MKTKIVLTAATSLALALGISASGNHVHTDYRNKDLILQDTVDDEKTDADSLPIPAPGVAPGKVDSTPFPQDTPRPVDPTPSPRPADPPVPQPVKPQSAKTTPAP
ncbi:hypothetical protein B0I27_105312 [Arcticibacter pallidicorallinus]|uniref:Uncharacterized protein n=1 Tax=Arcticibacter pallidicorallinus TaxID=1259464 RepID=A0A2T0U4M6_9SPHI|nr:hypothetical protein [Arcticibacter pallidicorallinus]PRY52842.1 hypothetical protein B0I27_105312 [Arcticibacter pallidicorallinus]